MRDDTEVDAVAAVGQRGLKVAGLVESVCWESRYSVVKVFSWVLGVSVYWCCSSWTFHDVTLICGSRQANY